MEYGSLQNGMLAGAVSTTPVVGMGATEISWSDRAPFTITKVINEKTIEVQADKVRWGGPGYREMGDNSKWVCEPNPEGVVYTLTKRKNGKWIRKEESIKGRPFRIGERDSHHDDSR